jgi:LPS-assembly lipoprotein
LFILPSACGFQPLYGRQTQNAVVSEHLAATYVLPIEGRVGQIVRNELLDRMTPAGLPAEVRYRLEIKLSERKQGLAIDKDDSTNRFNLTLTARYKLLDPAGQTVVHESSTQAIAAYNVIAADFANLSAEQNARKRSALVVAENIHRELSAYLSR